MNRADFDISAGITFLEVARCGSVRKAAERLHLAPSAVSRHVGRLERSFETILLERRADGVALTASGEILRGHLIDLLRHVDLMRDALAARPGGSGKIRLVTIEGITRDFLSPQIAAFTRGRPSITFNVDVRPRDKVFDALEQYEAEIGFIYDHFSHPAIEAAGQWRQPLMAFVGADHRLASGQALSLQDLDGQPCVLPDASFGIHRLVTRAFQRAGAVPDVQLVSNHLHFLSSHAMRINAMLFAPLRAVQTEVLGGRLVPVNLVCREFEHRFVSAAVRRGRPLTAAASEFLGQVLSAFSAAEAEDDSILAEARQRAWLHQA